MSCIGYIVKPVEGHVIACGSGYYERAVVVSGLPYILVSEEGDMIWYWQSPNNFEVVERASAKVRKIAYARYCNSVHDHIKDGLVGKNILWKLFQ